MIRGSSNLGLESVMTVELARGLSEQFTVGAETEQPAGHRVREPIAIVGRAWRLIGADSVEELWELFIPALVCFLPRRHSPGNRGGLIWQIITT
jgi:hypothetical protein